MVRYAQLFSGMGFGLVIAALLMMSMTPKQSLPSKAEVETLARSYGMVYQEEVLNFQPSLPANVEQVTEPEKIETVFVSDLIKVRIPKGSSSEQISRILEEKEVINDRMMFTKRVKERGVSVKLEAGDFEFSPVLTIDEVIDQLLIKERRR